MTTHCEKIDLYIAEISMGSNQWWESDLDQVRSGSVWYDSHPGNPGHSKIL
jgi:hypothetical protein